MFTTMLYDDSGVNVKIGPVICLYRTIRSISLFHESRVGDFPVAVFSSKYIAKAMSRNALKIETIR